LEKTNAAIVNLTLDIGSGNHERQRGQVLDWLSDHQYEAQYRRGCQLHCTDTCAWLLHHPELIKWSQSRSALLWLQGQAGSGKTIATSYLIRHLSRSTEDDKTLLAYFYYDASTAQSLTPETFFGAILKQICAQMVDLPADVVSAYRSAASHSGTPKQAQLEELTRLVRGIMESGNQIILVIDGLDESPDYGAVCDFLCSAIKSGKYPLRIFISSRPGIELRRVLGPFQHMTMPANAIDEDMSIYIRSRINKDSRLRRMRDDLKHYVESTLRADSHGMFRWVQCQLDEISRLRTDKALKQALRQLPPNLEESYSRILGKIGPEDAIFAQRTLLWLAHVSTPLTLHELAEAVVLEPGSRVIDPESRLNDPLDVVDICGSLVAFNPAFKTVRIAHHSVREYLTRHLDGSSIFSLPEKASQRAIAEACINYLLLSDFAAGPRNHADLRWMLTKFPLLRYAAQNWPFHVTRSGCESELQPLILELMTPRANPKFLFWLQVVLYNSMHGYKDPITELSRAQPLYYAASYGLAETVRSLITAGANLDDQAGRYGGTALHAACWRRKPQVLPILLEAGADTTIRDLNESTPADLALWTGDEKVINLMVTYNRIDQKIAQTLLSGQQRSDGKHSGARTTIRLA